jgi:CheY-like chemotaxis protein
MTPDATKTRVVVIDDQEPIRRIIRRALESHGYEVLDASDGLAGLALLERGPVDVVITDIFMPGQDGIVTLRRIRKEFPGIKVIVISGGDSTGLLDMRRDAEFLGALRSLQKPFTAADIVRVVAEVLGQSVA